MEKVLVTGITGFLGSHTAIQLLNKGYSVTGTLRDTSRIESIEKVIRKHEGFQDALYPAVIQLTNAIDAFRTRRQKIWVTGHSLGGALCSLYAGMLIENGYDIFGIYNFASPRPADASFSKQLIAGVKGPHFRVVNKMDIVPHAFS